MSCPRDVKTLTRAPSRHIPHNMFNLLCNSMFSLSFLVFLLALSVAPHVGASRGTVRAALASRYSRTHSLGPSYKFDARDGWHTINATNLLYQPRRLHDSAYDLYHANTKN